MAIAGTTAAIEDPPPTATRPGPQPIAAAGRLPHFPALDGLRGLAVAAVVLFHGGFSWMTGGYLGVSTFFTLSGFLITALLLTERSRTSSVDLRRFWTRRFRRLMPAALAALGLATVFGIVAADAVQRRNLAGDVTASLAYVANWRFIASGQAYADLFGAPSPVLHFWSLAIEEQFYLLYPLLVWIAFRVLRVSRSAFGWVLAALIGASVGLTLFAGFEPDRIYFGTDTRAAELLIGGLLATVIFDHRVTHAIAHDRRAKPVVAGVGAVALLVCAALWVTVPQETAWLYRGGFPAYAALSALVILAAISPFGPVRTVLGVRPLRELGRISYGVYLYHWPIFLWLSPERTGWSDAALLLPRLALTFALALASYRYLETPVRRGAPLWGTRPVRYVPFVAAALVIATVVVTTEAPKPAIDLDQAAAELEMLATASDGAATSPADLPSGELPAAVAAQPAAAPAGVAPRPRIAVFGDSTAMMTAIGLYRWGVSSGEVDMVPGAAWLGCGIGRGGERRSGNEYGVVPEHCNEWATTWAAKVDAGKPNIAVVQIGPWDVTDRRLPGDDTWRAPGDPVYDEYLLNEMTDAVDTLSAQGAQVLWLSAPPVGAGTLGDAREIRGVAAEPERTARVNELIAQLPTLRPGKVSVVDLAGWLASTGEDIRLRPDGVHFGADQATEVADRYLGHALIEAFQHDWALADARRTATAATARRRVLVLGDASARGVADALTAWGADSGLMDVVTIGQPPCGVLHTTSRRGPDGVESTPDECAELQYGWMQSAVAARADIVLVVPSIWDLTDLANDDGTLRAVGDPVVDERFRAELAELSRALTRTPSSVVWLTAPTMAWPGAADGSGESVIDPTRSERYNDLLADVADAAPGTTVVDLATLLGDRAPAASPAGTEVEGFSVDPRSDASLGERLGTAVLDAAG